MPTDLHKALGTEQLADPAPADAPTPEFGVGDTFSLAESYGLSVPPVKASLRLVAVGAAAVALSFDFAPDLGFVDVAAAAPVAAAPASRVAAPAVSACVVSEGGGAIRIGSSFQAELPECVEIAAHIASRRG